MTGNKRSDLSIGLEVSVVQKSHQRSGELTRGNIARILTNSPNHPHGIKAVSYTHLTLPTTPYV